MATNFSGGRSRSTLGEPPTMGKQLVSFITCGCEEILLKVALNTINQIKSNHVLILRIVMGPRTSKNF
jgi:hypothetical protein